MANPESKTCQNCKAAFVIAPEDFQFYKKISVPPPTWCPECRLIRRLVWRNERTLYKRRCDVPGHTEELITYIAPEKPYVVYDQAYWWSDAWDPTAYGAEYDFSKPFFTQFKELLDRTPLSSLSTNHSTMVNSEYSNWAGNLKNCYLVTDADFVEDSAYSSSIFESKDCVDCNTVSGCELCYECVNCIKSYRTVYSVNCHECTDVWFSKFCLGCSHCFGCIDLRKKSYYIFNEPYSKDAYHKKVAELIAGGSWNQIEKIHTQTAQRFLNFPHRAMRGLHNVNVSGDYVYHSKNVHSSFLVSDAEDSKYLALIHSPGTKDCFDYTDWGDNAWRVYESIACGLGVADIKFCNLTVLNSKNAQYSYWCYGCSDIFGCSNLRKRQWCILNKQYTQEEYETLVPKIIEHMKTTPYTDPRGRVYSYGEFFPFELSRFAYNETMAQELFPLTQEQAIMQAFPWRQGEPKRYSISKPAANLPQTTAEAGQSIVEETVGCAHEGGCAQSCTMAFRITPQELRFYQKLNLPLPRLCPNCRHYERLKERNPMHLWFRACMCAGERSGESGTGAVYKNTTTHSHGKDRCPNEFATSYSPDRPEIVYCIECFTTETW